MAHLRELPRCDSPGCGKPATEALYTFRNDRHGNYCARHAKGALAKVEATEQALFARQSESK